MGGREGGGGGGGGDETDDGGGCGEVEGGEYGGDDAGDGGGRGIGIGVDTVGKERDEGPHKSRKSTDSGGVCVREERTRLIKGDITGNPNATSNRIPTTISLTLSIIAKEHTLDRLC